MLRPTNDAGVIVIATTPCSLKRDTKYWACIHIYPQNVDTLHGHRTTIALAGPSYPRASPGMIKMSATIATRLNPCNHTAAQTLRVRSTR